MRHWYTDIYRYCRHIWDAVSRRNLLWSNQKRRENNIECDAITPHFTNSIDWFILLAMHGLPVRVTHRWTLLVFWKLAKRMESTNEWETEKKNWVYLYCFTADLSIAFNFSCVLSNEPKNGVRSNFDRPYNWRLISFLCLGISALRISYWPHFFHCKWHLVDAERRRRLLAWR